jgi:hypothetical protein
MPIQKIEIRGSQHQEIAKYCIAEKFKNFCRDFLSKKKGTKFQVTPRGAMIEANKIILFKILRELKRPDLA